MNNFKNLTLENLLDKADLFLNQNESLKKFSSLISDTSKDVERFTSSLESNLTIINGCLNILNSSFKELSSSLDKIGGGANSSFKVFEKFDGFNSSILHLNLSLNETKNITQNLFSFFDNALATAGNKWDNLGSKVKAVSGHISDAASFSVESPGIGGTAGGLSRENPKTEDPKIKRILERLQEIREIKQNSYDIDLILAGITAFNPEAGPITLGGSALNQFNTSLKVNSIVSGNYSKTPWINKEGQLTVLPSANSGLTWQKPKTSLKSGIFENNLLDDLKSIGIDQKEFENIDFSGLLIGASTEYASKKLPKYAKTFGKIGLGSTAYSGYKGAEELSELDNLINKVTLMAGIEPKKFPINNEQDYKAAHEFETSQRKWQEINSVQSERESKNKKLEDKPDLSDSRIEWEIAKRFGAIVTKPQLETTDQTIDYVLQNNLFNNSDLSKRLQNIKKGSFQDKFRTVFLNSLLKVPEIPDPFPPEEQGSDSIKPLSLIRNKQNTSGGYKGGSDGDSRRNFGFSAEHIISDRAVGAQQKGQDPYKVFEQAYGEARKLGGSLNTIMRNLHIGADTFVVE